MSDIKKDIQKFATKVGIQAAVVKLVGAGVSTRAAERLCLGTYDPEPKALRNTLIRVLQENGFKAS